VSPNAELEACIPEAVDIKKLNPTAQISYGCTVDHIFQAMNDFVEFLSFINQQLYTREVERLESMLMPANFSSIVGEFFASALPKYCSAIVRNQYHNGHPDLLPIGMYPDNAAQHAPEGIEIKASRYVSGWQGHNPEDVWLMVLMFDCNRPTDKAKGIPPRPFRFLQVVGARLEKSDWVFSGRSVTSRRTITASVALSGYQKLTANWIYKADRLE
jgi:hypothetical protein